MSGTSLLVKNPREAAKAFSSQPKQRNLFVLRFYAHGQQAGADQDTLTATTFIVKAAERPKVNPKTEELHQYNKKRQIYTGFKLEPVRIQFYDDAKSSALMMWQDYSRYYFGDMNPNVAASYGYDVTSAQFLDNAGTGFGFTGNTATGDGNFYFDRIELYHYYDQYYDVYQMIHPRITMFDPDDLDYENSAIAVITMSIVYENLQFAVQQQTSSGDASQQPFDEFALKHTFDGEIIQMSSMPLAPSAATPVSLPTSSSTTMAQLLAIATQQPTTPVNNARYDSTTSSGSLGTFGNFLFGPPALPNNPIPTLNTLTAALNTPANTSPTAPGQTPTSSLTTMAQTNTALATALDTAQTVDPLTVTQNTPQGTINTTTRQGVDGAKFDVAMAQAKAVTTPYGNPNMLTTAILSSAAITGNGAVATPAGVVLTPQGYGVINAQQTGTAQYGFNTNTSPTDGASWGYTGAAGYLGPVGAEDDGPYSANRPSGLYARYGILPEPLGIG